MSNIEQKIAALWKDIGSIEMVEPEIAAEMSGQILLLVGHRASYELYGYRLYTAKELAEWADADISGIYKAFVNASDNVRKVTRINDGCKTVEGLPGDDEEHTYVWLPGVARSQAQFCEKLGIYRSVEAACSRDVMTVALLSYSLGASKYYVRKVVQEGIGQGKVRKCGKATAGGRPAQLYETTTGEHIDQYVQNRIAPRK